MAALLTSGLLATAFHQNCGSNKKNSFTLLEKGDATITTATTILNCSGTHAVDVLNQNYWEPESVQDVERIVKHCHERGQPIRPLGSALSPNGIAFHPGGMISMENLDQVLAIDTEQRTVAVQAGARVSQVVDTLRQYQLTLPNLASIAEQQMGGFVQVGAHGTGKYIAPVDEYVTSMKLVTPGKGTVVLTKDKDGELFQLAKVGLGCLGVVVEITMECVPAHKLVEHTFVLTRQQAKEQLDDLLEHHKHMRYMWIPYTDTVVCVTNDPEDTVTSPELRKKMSSASIMSPEERFRPLVDLLIEVTRDTPEPYTEQTVRGMGFGELRDALLAVNPLDVDHVRRCNEAEAEFWRCSEGYQIRPSDELLQFDCGGQQWVWELCFPTGTQESNNGNDMLVMEELLKGIEERNIPAHSPIEQRWTASSSSLMSPAHGPPNGLHSWVGIINYLPSDNELQRREITNLFTEIYCDLFRQVGDRVGAASHWAKLECPSSFWKIVDLRIALQNKFPLQSFNALRAIYDPKNILASPLINLTLGEPKLHSNIQQQ
jgi:L-galactono-1,4-lactone dehydrogenase